MDCKRAILDVYTQLRKTSTFTIGETLVEQKSMDHDTVCHGLALLSGLLSECISRWHMPEFTEMWQGRFRTAVVMDSEDLNNLLSELDELDEMIIKHMSTYPAFKGQEFIGAIHSWNCTSQSMQVLRACLRHLSKVVGPQRYGCDVFLDQLHTVATFLKKMVIEREDLQRLAYNDFYDFEMSLRLLDSLHVRDDEYLSLCKQLNTLATHHLSGIDFSILIPQHGPGVIADKSARCSYEKYSHMEQDARISYMLTRTNGSRIADYNPIITSRQETDRVNRFIAVPKTWKKLRGISAEPGILQFFQQGVRGVIQRFISNDPWWLERVTLSNQTKSQDLAAEASISGALATLDLSAASDSVTTDLVKRVFGNTELTRWLLATRSTSTLCDNVLIRGVKKFAPMGSGTCFIVETLIFTLIAQLAVDRTQIPVLDRERRIRVYGDDIILPTYAAAEAQRILKVLGFSLNKEKSYDTGNYREACGCEAWLGRRVDPVRYKKGLFFGRSQIQAEDIARCIDLVNSLEIKGFHATARSVLRAVLHTPIEIDRSLKRNFEGKRVYAANAIVFAPWELLQDPKLSHCIYSTHANNFNLVMPSRRFTSQAKRLSENLQQSIMAVINYRPVPTKASRQLAENCPDVDLLRYTEWLIRHQAVPNAVDERENPDESVLASHEAMWGKTNIGERLISYVTYKGSDLHGADPDSLWS